MCLSLASLSILPLLHVPVLDGCRLCPYLQILENALKACHVLQGLCIIKLFKALINSVVYYASNFVIVSHFLLTLIKTLTFYASELITAVKRFFDTGNWSFCLFANDEEKKCLITLIRGRQRRRRLGR